jgi:uncharacterized protein (TIGR03086 family)
MSDPRPFYDRAAAQLAALIAAVPAARLDDPTPCTEFDVRGLIAHIVGSTHGLAELGEKGVPGHGDPVVTGVPDDGWADAYDEARQRLIAAWADDAKLTTPVTVPWGEMPGAALLASGCVLETVVHTWDLSHAVGHPIALDQELAEYALGWARKAVAADRRGPEVPFGPVQPAPEGSDAYGLLAAWLGRKA